MTKSLTGVTGHTRTDLSGDAITQEPGHEMCFSIHRELRIHKSDISAYVATVIKGRGLGLFNNKNVFPCGSEPGSPRPKCQWGRFLPRPLP